MKRKIITIVFIVCISATAAFAQAPKTDPNITKILSKLEEIQRKLEQVLDNQDKLFEELDIIRVRASRR